MWAWCAVRAWAAQQQNQVDIRRPKSACQHRCTHHNENSAADTSWEKGLQSFASELLKFQSELACSLCDFNKTKERNCITFLIVGRGVASHYAIKVEEN